MKKSFWKIAAIAFASLFVCTGCGILGGGTSGGGGEEEDESTFGSASGKTVVTYYSFNNEQTNRELQKAVEEDFNVKYPGIHVDLRISTGSFFTNVFNDFAGGTAADIIGMEPGEIAPFVMYDYLEPLDDYFATSEIVHQDDIWAVNKQAYCYDQSTMKFGTGKLYAVMKDWSTDAMLFYNKALLSEEQLAIIGRDANNDGIGDPMTFDEFSKLAVDLIKSDSKGSVTQYGYLPGLHEAKVLAQFLANAGLSWFDPATGYSTFKNADVQNVLNMYYTVLAKNDKDHAPGNPYPIFRQGQVAMCMGGLYCTDMYDFDGLGDNLGIAYPPVKTRTAETTESIPYTTGCVGFAINKESKSKKASFRFIEWYLDYFGAQDARKLNNFPALQKYADSIMLNPEINTNATMRRIAACFNESLKRAAVIDRNLWCSQASFEGIENMYAGELMETIRGKNNNRPLSDFCDILDSGIRNQVDQRKRDYETRG